MAFPTHILAAAGITEDRKGNVLLVKTYNNGWVYPGGQVEIGESIPNAVIRETKEESGIDIVVGPLVGIYSNTGTHLWHDGKTHVPTKAMFDFVCYYKGGELCISDETSDSIWYPKEKALEFITHPAMVLRYQAYLDYCGKILYADYVSRPEFILKSRRYV